MIRAVLLDVDDTLCLTEAVCFDLENHVLRLMGRESMSREIHVATWGTPMREAMSLRSPGIDVDEFIATYEPLLHERQADGRLDTISADNLAAMDALIAMDLDVMLVTSRTHSEVAHMLADDHVLAERVTAIYHGGNTTHLKPDPRVFDVVLASHGLDAHECIYVGDSPGDAAAATGAGMAFVACMEGGLRTPDDFAAYEVSAFVERFADIVTVVGRRSSESDTASRV